MQNVLFTITVGGIEEGRSMTISAHAKDNSVKQGRLGALDAQCGHFVCTWRDTRDGERITKQPPYHAFVRSRRKDIVGHVHSKFAAIGPSRKQAFPQSLIDGFGSAATAKSQAPLAETVFQYLDQVGCELCVGFFEVIEQGETHMSIPSFSRFTTLPGT
ncbi:hypothetical protein QA649_04320 [Bradyrhizobium sp. CB1717]|uniref:hypothetical protein n=1 Tax=Bradyrhizobium sp. CB1717 TaxID=3039154 RepID=UPI0024B0D84F|nr:hypothetical protein [Bradyrhizobium sp. CB1717]WFU25476.1 hypothetical protein QA649_04320 [Bradyrhizobium sp. CB1717]